jgi:SSS family solute:Na+ symporter
MIAGLIIVPIVSAVTPSPDRKFVDDVFSVYEQKVLVRKSHSLEDE